MKSAPDLERFGLLRSRSSSSRSTFQVKKPRSFYPRVHTDAAAAGVVSSAGMVLLVEAVAVSGLDAALSRELARWRKPTAVHDPAKILVDLALVLAAGGDC